jgi:hypothetical protein
VPGNLRKELKHNPKHVQGYLKWSVKVREAVSEFVECGNQAKIVDTHKYGLHFYDDRKIKLRPDQGGEAEQ